MLGDLNKTTVNIKFKHCYMEENTENCASDEEAAAFWTNPHLYVYVNDFHRFSDLRNQTDPLQWTTNLNQL